MKKLLSTLMALTMAMSISTVAFAAEAPPTYEWDKKNGVLTLYSDQGYEDLFRDYITENNLDKKTADEFAVSYEIMNSLKTLRFGKDAGCYFPSEQFDTIESIEVDEDNPYMCVFDKALYTKDKKKLLAYPYASDDVDVYIPVECENFSDEFTFTYYCHKMLDGDWMQWFKPLGKNYNFYFADPTGEQAEEMLVCEGGMIYPTEGIYVVNDTCRNKLRLFYAMNKANIVYFISEFLYAYLETKEMEDINGAVYEKMIEYSQKEDELIDEYLETHETFGEWDFYYENLKFYEDIGRSFIDCAEECGLVDVLKNYDDLYQVYLEICDQKSDYVKLYDSSIKIATENVNIKSGETATFTSEVKMPEGEITWYVDGEKAGTGETFTVEKLTVGEHTVKSVVVFPNGGTSESNEVSVTVTKQTFVQRVAEFFRNISTFFTSILAKIVGIAG